MLHVGALSGAVHHALSPVQDSFPDATEGRATPDSFWSIYRQTLVELEHIVIWQKLLELT